MQSLKKLISILNDNQFHSGTSIGEQLGLTKSGVWKLVHQLTALGIEFESVTNKGYRMIHTLELLDKTKIRKNISKNNLRLINQLSLFDELPSTNDYLVSQAKHNKLVNAACLAEQQTAGRGRLGREWISPFAANIYLSLLWHFSCDISELAGLNIVIAIAVAEAISNATECKDIKLKWPNDIFCNGKKLGGILIDVIGEYSGKCAAVIGAGINVNMPEAYANKINKPWTDLHTATGSIISRNKLAGFLLDKLVLNLIIFQESGIESFISKWKKLDYLYGKQIVIESASTIISGIAKGINDHGHLQLKNNEGELISITTGDASVLSSVGRASDS